MVNIWLLTAVLGILIAFLVLFAKKTHGKGLGRRRGNNVLLCGQSGTGKTTIFLRLVSPHQPPTVTSAACNRAVIDGFDPLMLIDIPGNRKVRDLLWQEEVAEVHSIIFMINGNLSHEVYKDVPFFLKTLSTALSLHVPFLLIISTSSADAVNVLLNKLEEECKAELKKYINQVEDEVDNNEITLLKKTKFMEEILNYLDHDPSSFSLSSLKEAISFETITTRPHDSDQVIESLRNWLS